MGAWLLQVLQMQYDATILTWGPVDSSVVNQAYGTNLDPARFRNLTVPAAPRRLLGVMPRRLDMLRSSVLSRAARRALASEHYDLVVSSMNELDVGRHVVQYVHFPWGKFPRPDATYQWWQWSPPARAYRALARSLSAFDDARVAANTTVVNSNWTGRVFSSYYGTQGRTVYPPVLGGFAEVPFERRTDDFLLLGRIAPEKRIEDVIAILAAVRARGSALRLRIVGQVVSARYARRIQRAVAPHRAWVEMLEDVPRTELVRLMSMSRYGIHGMLGEHFGIGPAELQRAGCITFVPDYGGLVEIVADARLRYRSSDDAIDKIHRVLTDPALRASVLAGVENRRTMFSEQRFMEEMSDVLERALGTSARGQPALATAPRHDLLA